MGGGSGQELFRKGVRLMSRAGALNTIDTLLATVSDPTFTAIVRGEPLSIAGSPTAAFFLTSRASEFLTFSDASSITTITIRVYFRFQDPQDVRETLEEDMWDCMVNVPSALRGDSTLSGNVTDLQLGTSTTGYISIGGIAYRTIDFPLELEILGEVTIAP